jgi:hypothetical protein
MTDFSHIAKNLKTGAKNIKTALNAQMKQMEESDLPEDQKKMLRDGFRDIEKGIAEGSMETILNTINNLAK